MRKAIRCLIVGLLMGGMLTCPAFASSAFSDVNADAGYAEAVGYLNEAGIMQGDENGNFNPNNTVTRAEMATIICRMLGETENLPTSTVFIDVPLGHWANVYVGKVAELGIVGGYGDGTFGPGDTVTYEQALTMVVRAMNMEELAIAAGGYPDGHLIVAQEQGMLSDISHQTGEIMSRASIAKIIYNALTF